MIQLTERANIAFARLGKVQIAAFAEIEGLDNRDLQEFIDTASADYLKNGAVEVFLVYAHKVPLTAMQRHMLVEATERIKATFKANAVITESVLVVAMIKFLQLFVNVKINAFTPAQMNKAIDWLREFTDFDKREANLLLRQMIDRLRVARKARNLDK